MEVDEFVRHWAILCVAAIELSVVFSTLFVMVPWSRATTRTRVWGVEERKGLGGVKRLRGMMRAARVFSCALISVGVSSRLLGQHFKTIQDMPLFSALRFFVYA